MSCTIDKARSESPIFILGEDSINGIKINEKIFDEELLGYRIMHRESFVDELIRWISEAKGSDKYLMKEDLEMLLKIEDEYMFSSTSTNEYFGKDDSEFNTLCEELLELNDRM